MWIIQIEILGVKIKILEFLDLNIYLFQTWIIYNSIHKGRIGHGSFFFLYIPNDNCVESGMKPPAYSTCPWKTSTTNVEPSPHCTS